MHVLEVICITQLETSPSNQQFIHSQERSQLNALPQCISVARQTGLSIGDAERQFGVYYREHVHTGSLQTQIAAQTTEQPRPDTEFALSGAAVQSIDAAAQPAE